MGRLIVFRLGHRIPRDRRVTGHVALVARAFGADAVWVDREDPDLEARIEDVVERFGGPFQVKTGVPWRRALHEWPGIVIHLTMYGEPLESVLPTLPPDDLLIVVGAGKVPGELFQRADYNVAIGNQPHSEIAAVAVFLDQRLKGAGRRKEFAGRLRIVPSPQGKMIEEVTGGRPG